MVRRTSPPRVGWSGFGIDARGRTGAWRNDRIALTVLHCGHPTALRPYYVQQLLDELGAFTLLREAQHAAELAHAALESDPQALRTDEACWRVRAEALGFGADFPMPKR